MLHNSLPSPVTLWHTPSDPLLPLQAWHIFCMAPEQNGNNTAEDSLQNYMQGEPDHVAQVAGFIPISPNPDKVYMVWVNAVVLWKKIIFNNIFSRNIEFELS